MLKFSTVSLDKYLVHISIFMIPLLHLYILTLLLKVIEMLKVIVIFKVLFPWQ